MRQTAQTHTQSQSKSQQQAATTTTQMRHTKTWSTFVRGFAAIKILIEKRHHHSYRRCRQKIQTLPYLYGQKSRQDATI